MTIQDNIKQLSDSGLISILEEAEHVQLITLNTREDFENVLQININEGLIDEIEILIVLSGE